MEIKTSLLQAELLNIMKVFHKVCEDNNLRYYMLGGTCLGAIRHKGFIPWDDDIDVGMPRRDYDIFCKKWKDYLPDFLEIRYYKTEPKSPFHFAKLIDNRTTLIEREYTDYVEGVYIDLFPLDAMKNYNLWGKIRSKLIWIGKAALINHCTTEKRKQLHKRLFNFISKKISLSFLHKIVEKLMLLENSDNPNLLCNFFGAWNNREFISFPVFGMPTLYNFEDSQFYGPQNADSYLRSLYGDYMQLPPENKRICRHDYYYVNLNLPYKNYKKEI
ncbi:MAG: LicD family protein [Fibrobacter sp.]|nr:LicD family protein [Fibrobacter sp.]